MASTFVHRSIPLIILIILLITSSHIVQSVQLDVGGDNGWTTPSPKDGQMYNDWASKNRFQVNDTLRFEYKKDSLLAVTKEEYEKCQSPHPIFFSNSGNTMFTLDRPGLFYFISGVSGHCKRGLKMVVKVLDPAAPPQAAAQSSHKKKSVASPSFATPDFVTVAVLLLGSAVFGVASV